MVPFHTILPSESFDRRGYRQPEYNLYLVFREGRICLNGVVAILNEMRR